MPVNPPAKVSAAAKVRKALPWLRPAAGTLLVMLGAFTIAPTSLLTVVGCVLLGAGLLLILEP
jgi:hypothetical protein